MLTHVEDFKTSIRPLYNRQHVSHRKKGYQTDHESRQNTGIAHSFQITERDIQDPYWSLKSSIKAGSIMLITVTAIRREKNTLTSVN